MHNNNYDLLVGGDALIALPVVNLNAANNLGAFADMGKTDKLNVFITMAAGTADQNPVLELQQAKTAAGGDVKALNITDLSYKAGADLLTIADWTKVEAITRHDSVASYSALGAGAATLMMAFAIRVHEADLDVNNGFRFVRLKIDTFGAGARVGTAIYIATGMGYQGLDKASLLGA